MNTLNSSNLPNIYVVRADFGKWTKAFYEGGYVGIGWLRNKDLSDVTQQGKDYLRALYEESEPDASLMRKVVNVAQIWRFLTDLTPGTKVLTPMEDREKLIVGTINGEYYYEPSITDSRFSHRMPVKWESEPLLRSVFSVPLQNTLGSSLTVFNVSQTEEILTNLSFPIEKVSKPVATAHDLSQRVIERMLELTADDFEILVTQVLTAIGFEARHVGRVGDGGIDVEGVLEVYGFAKIDLMVQVKRYGTTTIKHGDIKKFRGSVPERFQAAFVTTSDFTAEARKEAIREGYKRIGLLNGSQLVDILVEHYDDLSTELKDQLRLRRTLMPE